MAVPMDASVTNASASEARALCLPPAALPMPLQRLDRRSRPRPTLPRARKSRGGNLAARLVVFGLALALTAYGTWNMLTVVGENATFMQSVLVIMFALTFAWIAMAAANALLGFTLHFAREDGSGPSAIAKLVKRTAIVMPVYNEDTQRVFASLEGMARELIAAGRSWHFDIFVLSDSNDPEIARNEVEAAQRLRREMLGRMQVCYRRRLDNVGRKAGNIADFIRRWGAAYDFMIVLDADSYMTAEAMVELARAMEQDADAGLIQTAPRLAGRNTLFARMQQFSTAVYGPVLAAGIAAWQGREGNYWGHNAIIRIAAFAESCGLPEIKGRKPFGGHILSHDFVEAALLRRAGWDVYMRPDIAGSYEQAPPTLADHAVRDRRWAQGNLQHGKVIGAAGLHWMSRFHLFNGIMSYMASPLWLMFLATGFLLGYQAEFVPPVYFPENYALFPTWPLFDAEAAFALMRFALVVLLLPKFLGLTAALFDRQLRRGTGGVLGMTVSAIAETLLSALLAPVLMLLQTRFIVDIMMARDSGWGTQRRDDGASTFADAARRHAMHTLAGLLLSVVLLSISWNLWLWLLPVWLGLSLAIPIVHVTGQRSFGEISRRWGLFLIPEERKAAPRGGWRGRWTLRWGRRLATDTH